MSLPLFRYLRLVVRLLNYVSWFLSLLIIKLGIPNFDYTDAIEKFVRLVRLPKLSFPRIDSLGMLIENAGIKRGDDKPKWQEPEVELHTVERGGVKLTMRVVRSCQKAVVLQENDHFRIPTHRRKQKVMFFACPLGQCGLSIFYPIMAHYGEEYTYVTWDYRGFFESSSPNSARRVSIHEHAEDGAHVLNEFLQQLGVERTVQGTTTNDSGSATAEKNEVEVVAVGHSMGVQVLLELSLLYPKFADRMVLLNGAHGQVFSTAFQPVFPLVGLHIPLLGSFARALVAFVCSYPKAISMFYEYIWKHDVVDFVLYLWGTSVMGSQALRTIWGRRYLGDFFHSYLTGISSTERNSHSYARMFQELDMHSVRHLLHHIEVPTLLVSGFWDMYTPCSHMFEMARKMPNATHYCDFYSTHASIVENPEAVVTQINAFLSPGAVANVPELYTSPPGSPSNLESKYTQLEKKAGNSMLTSIPEERDQQQIAAS